VRRLAVAAVVLAAAALAWRALASPPLCRVWDPFCLPEALEPEEVIVDLTPAAGAATGLEVLAPGDALGGGGRRVAALAPPPTRIALRAPTGAGTELRVAMGVEGAKLREDGRSGVRFVVTVGGREAFRRDVNPAGARRDRRWVEATVPLPANPGEAEIVLETAAVDGGLPLAGRPGWSALRVVRRTRVPRQTSGPGAPNLLVLLVDTLRADAVGAYGAAAPTPTLDALAARGLVFEQAVAAASWTLPSVASLLTGLHAVSHGAVGSREDAWGGDFLPDALVTWPEAAAGAGITTVGVSSNPLVSRATNLAQGFETFVELPWDPKGRDWPSADEVHGAFLGWLARNRGRRFAAWLHYMDVHDPYMPEPAHAPAAPPDARPAVARGRVNDIAKAVNSGRMPPLADAHVRHLRALYDAEVQEWDAALARLLDGLRAARVADDTIVVVTADHGEEFQEHGHLKHASHLYDEVLRVPLVLAGPGIRPGRVAEQVAGVDLAPTLLALLRLPVPEGVAGADLLAARPAAPALSETRKAVGRDGRLMRLVSLRHPDWKLIEEPDAGAVEIYDLRRDAAERKNIAGASESAALRRELAHVLAAAPPPPAHAGTDSEMAEKLRALGYAR
jgi:arylsulfatase A-like enzyme